jgi:hypothetical protein
VSFWLFNEATNRTIRICVEASWMVVMECENGHGGRWGVDDLAQRFTPETTLEEIAARLVCSTCGARRGNMTVRNDTAAAYRRDIARFEASGRTPGIGTRP